ncbi:hypothetical protein DFH06DRAFT_1183444 [Mycena polygramma]|nr:hypothetical protein DFH06DRAFT_1183444 [Mycena polygramma]
MDSPAELPSNSLPVRDAPELTNPGGDGVANRSALRHLAILSALFVPIGCLPLLIGRRQMASLRRRIDEVGATTALLKRQGLAPGAEPGAATALITQMRQEMEVMRQQLEHRDSKHAESLSAMTMDIVELSEDLELDRSDISTRTHANDQAVSEVQEQIRVLRGEQEALRSEVFKISDMIQSAKTGPQDSELQRLLLETKQTRYCAISWRMPRATFGAIGTSLGDIATIIHQVQIEMGHERSAGYDPVERLRVLALQMQDQSERPKQGRVRA